MKYPKQAYERDPEVLHLYVKDIRILTPKEYDALKTAIPKETYKIILDILLIAHPKTFFFGANDYLL